jgi:predicted phosphoribosyltransferase
VNDFANLVDGGRRLGLLLSDALSGEADALLLPAIPNGVPVAVGIREAIGLAVRGLPVDRSDAGAVVAPMPDLAGRIVVVVDDGVETGTVARAAARALRQSGVARLLLAVPVCPREATADLQMRYDGIVSVVRPMARHDLAGHYDTFDTIDEESARSLLATMQRG